MATTLFSTDAITAVVRSALVKFTQDVEARLNVKATDAMWTAPVAAKASCATKSDRPPCPAILQSGKNKGQACGKPCAVGKEACSAHVKKGVATESATKTSTGNSTPVSNLVKKATFHKSSFGNFVFEGFVFDKVAKGISGKETADGKIVSLDAADITRVRALNLKVVEAGAPAPVAAPAAAEEKKAPVAAPSVKKAEVAAPATADLQLEEVDEEVDEEVEEEEVEEVDDSEQIPL